MTLTFDHHYVLIDQLQGRRVHPKLSELILNTIYLKICVIQKLETLYRKKNCLKLSGAQILRYE